MSRDDIAALEVVADPKARFQHKLCIHNVDLRWILKRTEVPPSTDTSRQQSRAQTAIEASADVGGADSSAAGHPNRPQSASNDTNKSRKHELTFVDAPPLLSLDMLDTSTAVEDKSVLLNSPRSIFVVLKNGLSVHEICAVSKQQYFNDGLLDGVTVETVQMRIAAENERRGQKFQVLLREYRNLCSNSSCEEVVDAIRSHRYGFENEQSKNSEQLRSIPHYAHAGKLDISVLDTDCIDVMVKSRGRTLNEIRRVLNQRDKVLHQAIDKERSLFEKEANQERESKRVQQQQQNIREEKAHEFRAKRERVQERVKLLIGSQDERREQRREAMIVEREVHEQRAAERKALDRHASEQLIGFREKRRRRAREAQESMLEERRSKILEKQDFVTKIHERQMQLKKEELNKRSVQFNKLANERRSVIREITENEYHTRVTKMLDVEEKAEERTREFNHVREVRQGAKRQAAEARAVRGAATRLNAEAIKMQRLAELERQHDEKLSNIEIAQREKHERLVLENEVSAQVRLEKTEEKKRSHSAMEFQYIGYMNSNHSKTTWMEREALKRKTLAGHVRQEREAMSRARDQVVSQLDQTEISRKKRDNAKHFSGNHSL